MGVALPHCFVVWNWASPSRLNNGITLLCSTWKGESSMEPGAPHYNTTLMLSLAYVPTVPGGGIPKLKQMQKFLTALESGFKNICSAAGVSPLASPPASVPCAQIMSMPTSPTSQEMFLDIRRHEVSPCLQQKQGFPINRHGTYTKPWPWPSQAMP